MLPLDPPPPDVYLCDVCGDTGDCECCSKTDDGRADRDCKLCEGSGFCVYCKLGWLEQFDVDN